MASSNTQQGPYVSSGEPESFLFHQSFLFSCRGEHEANWGNRSENSNTLVLGVASAPEDECEVSELKGLDVVEPPDFQVSCGSSTFFCGLTTCPTMAVVDTAAQDGLVGDRALVRLEEKLAACGLRVRWTGKQAKAHGVGGQAVAKGIIAIPLGIAGTSGLKATAVEGDIPLLLPVKLRVSSRVS